MGRMLGKAAGPWLALTTLTIALTTSAAPAADPIKVGLDAALSGQSAASGEAGLLPRRDTRGRAGRLSGAACRPLASAPRRRGTLPRPPAEALLSAQRSFPVV